MRRISYVVVLLIVAVSSYLLLRGDGTQNKAERRQPGVVSELGKEVSRLIFDDAKDVVLYPVRSGMDDEGTTICGLVVSGKSMVLDKEDKEALLSLLSEKGMYLDEEVWPSAPFIPEYLFEFRSRGKVSHLAISLSGGFMNVFHDHQYVRTLKYTQEYRMLCLLSEIMPDDESLKVLLNLQTIR